MAALKICESFSSLGLQQFQPQHPLQQYSLDLFSVTTILVTSHLSIILDLDKLTMKLSECLFPMHNWASMPGSKNFNGMPTILHDTLFMVK